MALIRIVSVVIGVLLLAGSYLASSFWTVFLAPFPILVICQLVALRANVTFAEKFFGFTDLAYYLIIGAVIGLGTRYLPELDRVLQQDAEITFEQAQAALPGATEVAVQTSAARLEASMSLNNIPAEVLGECYARQLTADLERSIEIDPQPDRPALLLPDYPPGCEIPLAVVDVSARATGEAIIANDRLQELKGVVDRGPNASVRSSDFLTPEYLEWLLFRLFPTLVLCGVMLKVGKTTLSIRKST